MIYYSIIAHTSALVYTTHAVSIFLSVRPCVNLFVLLPSVLMMIYGRHEQSVVILLPHGEAQLAGPELQQRL